MRFTQDNLDTIYDADVVDVNGDKVGGVGQVYLDDRTGDPAWVTVNTGFFGMRESLVPLDGATVDGDRIQVPYEKAFIKDAPNVDVDAHLDDAQQDELYRYYQGGGQRRDSFESHDRDGFVDGDRGELEYRDRDGVQHHDRDGVVGAVADKEHHAVADKDHPVADRGLDDRTLGDPDLDDRGFGERGMDDRTLGDRDVDDRGFGDVDRTDLERVEEHPEQTSREWSLRRHERPMVPGERTGAEPMTDDMATQDPSRDGLGADPTDPMRDDLGEGDGRRL